MNNTKDQLVRTALRMFRSRPYNDVSLEQIAKTVGVTKGSLFHHFKNKEEIFRAAVELFYNDGVSTFKVGHNATLWECCQQYTTFFWAAEDEYPSSAIGSDILFLAESFRRMPGFIAYHHEQMQYLISQWVEVIDMAKLTGEIRPNINSAELAQLFLSIEDQILSVPVQLSRQRMLGRMRSLYNLVKVEED